MTIAPRTLNVLDAHGGFTILTRGKRYDGTFGETGDTLWRPGLVLKTRGAATVGTLIEVDEHTFYQTNDNVTRAIYRVPGYGYRVVAWFDNDTGERIA